MRSRIEIEKALTDAARTVAPLNELGRPTLTAEEAGLLFHIAGLFHTREQQTGGAAVEPSWIRAARSMLGQREVPGSKHNPWIATGWQRLKASWFNDDETPWCGFFVAWCLDQASLPYPPKGEFARALRWATWGSPCSPRLGAIATKTRAGGGHVFFIVGETPDKRFFKALGGNQSNMVSIVDILKTDVTAIRWPEGMALMETGLPTLPAGTISRNEG